MLFCAHRISHFAFSFFHFAFRKLHFVFLHFAFRIMHFPFAISHFAFSYYYGACFSYFRLYSLLYISFFFLARIHVYRGSLRRGRGGASDRTGRQRRLTPQSSWMARGSLRKGLRSRHARLYHQLCDKSNTFLVLSVTDDFLQGMTGDTKTRGSNQRPDAMYIRTLVLREKFTNDRYYGSHLNFKPKQ